MIAVLYVSGLLFFQLLGGLSSAADAIQRWGRWSSEQQRSRIEQRLEAARMRRDAP